MTSRTTRAAGLALAVGLALGTTACGSDEIADKLTEKAIEGAASGDADVDIDSDSGEMRIDTSDGTITSGGELPEDFPEDEVPLVEGELLQAIFVDEPDSTGYLVHLQHDAPTDEAVAEAVGLLEGAGFSVEDGQETERLFNAVTLKSPDYQVIVSGIEEPEGTMVQYMVTPLAAP